MLFQAACLQLRIRRPALMTTPDFAPTRTPPGRPDRTALTDSSTRAMKGLIHDRAAAAGGAISLDLFACGKNRACARFCSASHEDDAEATDAFSLPSWSESVCPSCQMLRPDFVLLFPPPHRVQDAVSRAYHDRAHGIAVLPYAPTTAWWHTIRLAAQPTAGKAGFTQQLRNSPTFLEHQSTSIPGLFISVMHFDFWRGVHPRPVPCRHAGAHRPRTHPWLHQDFADISALEALIITSPNTSLGL